ncbi:MAG: hypothetical protein M1819_004242 [Sarea resinae]|nr:MAG: hypothetical protein M1819_004242 [Sarea resinae]
MAAAIASATQSLTSLLRQTTVVDHEEILKASNAVLKKSKSDIDAQHAKVVALVKLDRYEDALRLFQEGGEKLKSRAPLERAYTLYKSGNYEEAERVARSVAESRGMKHVEAQAAYRLEKFSQTADLYKELAVQAAEVQNEENDIRINGGAADAQLEWAGQGHLAQKKKPGREDLEAFETAYNAACGSMARGEFAQGEILLKRAKDLCNASEELSDEEKVSELLPIAVQQIYVLSMLGKADEAAKYSKEITMDDIPDASTRKVAQNNLLTTSAGPENPFLAHRLFHTISKLPKTDQPFTFQSKILHSNSYAIDLISLKFTGVANSTSNYLDEHPSPSISPDVNAVSVINASAHAQCQAGKAGLKEILPLLERRPNDVGLILTIVQLYLLTNNPGSAISLLESFFKRLEQSTTDSDHDVRFAPGLVAVLVSLYTRQGRKSHVRTELAKAATYWRRKSKAAPRTSLLKAAGSSLLQTSTKDEELAIASGIFDILRQRDPSDRFAIAGFVASNATTDPEKISSDVDKLTPVPRLISGIDVDALESAGVPRPAVSATVEEANRKRLADDNGSKPAKKRVRKSRLPKSYDPTKTPDPERWLPLRDRASYRPKGKKGKQRAAALTQGGISEEAPVVAAKVEKPAGGGSGGGKAKKKKGKGGKW